MLAGRHNQPSSLPIISLRKDCQMQHRTRIDPHTVARYADLMREGVVFPPVTVWSDGDSWWLTDGFHRVAALERLGLGEVHAFVFEGTIDDARWASYASNGTHGLRRTPEEVRRVTGLALQHPNAGRFSNSELARYLCIPESTLRRWRNTLCPPDTREPIRLVTRGESRYLQNTTQIGKRVHTRRAKSRSDLQTELFTMKAGSSPGVRRLLNILANWIFAGATPEACLAALERLINESTPARP
jgi:hypothetical protein